MKGKREIWSQILDDLQAQMPDLTRADAGLCAELIGRQAFGVGRTVDELHQAHMATPGPHGDACSACGFFDAARYRQRTGRSLTADFLAPTPEPR